jgi:hypothetical protein
MAKSPSGLIHSWSFVYFKFSGMFMLTIIIEVI